ncbi:MAG: DUF4340 domain-containing protein [bacterium]
MSLRNLTVLLALALLAGGGILLLVWERGKHRDPAAPDERERLLIGFNPATVERVRVRYGERSAELTRQHGAWVPVSEAAAGGDGVRVGLLLQRLATLTARRVDPKSARGLDIGPRTRADAEIKVWRGRARSLLVRFHRRGRRLLLTSSDRPGIYQIQGTLLALLRREVGQPTLAAALSFSPKSLATVELQSAQRQLLVRRSERWFLEDNAAFVPADTTAVSRLLRALLAIRVVRRLGRGAAALSRHGLQKPRLWIRIDDGKRRSLRLGGACPRRAGATLAALGETPPEVVCVLVPDAEALAGPFVSNRLFSVAADEIRAVSVTWGNQTLALVNRPGSGGWSLISPRLDTVDQSAAADFVASLARLSGPTPRGTLPEGRHQVGTVALTPLVGSVEHIELWSARRGGPPTWARPVGGERWLQLRTADGPLLAADPILLRSRTLCTAPTDRIIQVWKTGADGVTELANGFGGTWQLVLLSGRKSLEAAAAIAASLETYRPAGSGAPKGPVVLGWKRPVLLVGVPDRVNLAALLHQVSSIRAERFVSGKVKKSHGFGKRQRQLVYVYEHSCTSVDHKRTCKRARCGLTLGGALPDGRCYARPAGAGVVFVASAALCKALRTPVVSRQVVSMALHRLDSITLTRGGKAIRLTRTARGGWKTSNKSQAGSWETAASALLTLAPLTAEAVDGYSGRTTGKETVRVVLRAPQIPPVELRFHTSEAPGEDQAWVYRKGLPVQYRVPKQLVTSLIRLTDGS